MKICWLHFVAWFMIAFPLFGYAQECWTQWNAFPGQDLHSIIWTGSQFITVGNEGTILTSPDGMTWTSRTSGTTLDLYSITWTGTHIVAVGGYRKAGFWDGIVLTSPDGITWTSRFDYHGSGIFSVTWTGKEAVAVGSSGLVIVSTDLLFWIPKKINSWDYLHNEPDDLHSVISKGTDIVAAGESSIMYGYTVQTFKELDDLKCIYWSGDIFLALGGYQSYSYQDNNTVYKQRISTSVDGMNWKTVYDRTSVGKGIPIFEGVVWNGNLFVVATCNDTLLVSSDGEKWKAVRTGINAGFKSIIWACNKFYAVGAAGSIASSNQSVVITRSSPPHLPMQPSMRNTTNPFILMHPQYLATIYGRTRIYSLNGKRVQAPGNCNTNRELWAPNSTVARGFYVQQNLSQPGKSD